MNKDSTVSIDKVSYDAPMQFICSKVEIRYLPDDMDSAFILYDGGHYPILAILIGESSYIKDVTRYMEIMQHEILLEKKMKYTPIIGLEYSSVAHKIAKDIIIFYLKANRIDIHFFDELFLN